MNHPLSQEAKRIEDLFAVDTKTLRTVTDDFVAQLEKGLTKEGSSIPMNATWVCKLPTGKESGSYTALDVGGTNIRVAQVTFKPGVAAAEIVQAKSRLPRELISGSSKEFWDYIAGVIKDFVEENSLIKNDEELQLGVCFSFPVTQHSLTHGILQRWTKGFNVDGVEGEDVVPMIESALASKGMRTKVTALINDTTGALLAGIHKDQSIKLGCIWGTGCNACYIESFGSIPKVEQRKYNSTTPMIINCEYGAFGSGLDVLPRTEYDRIVDEESPRPGQQLYEKLVAGFYSGEILRLVLVDLIDKKHMEIFKEQDLSHLRTPYVIDAGVLAEIESDTSASAESIGPLIKEGLKLECNDEELNLVRRLAEAIALRAARLSACGITSLCKKKGLKECHIGADGSVVDRYPQFQRRVSQAVAEIMDWGEDEATWPIEINSVNDGSIVGAALAFAGL